MRNRKKRFWVILTILIIVLLFLAAFNTSLKITHYVITSEKISTSFRIVFIADLHSCNYGKGQKKLINEIVSQNPNLIMLGGDIADDMLPLKNTELVLEALSDKYPCYFVSGNHEFWSGSIDDIKLMFKKYGVIVLEGDMETLNLKDQTINLCGIDDPEVGENVMLQQLKDCGSKVENSNYTILLAHRPEYIKNYLDYEFDLILSGHAHGGQWRIPFLINGLYAPNQGWFPKYAGGKYNFDNTTFIVSRGLAKESTRIPRIFNRPELVVIDVKKYIL